MPPTNPSRDELLLYAIPEAATALRISRTKLYELLDSGDVESVHIGRSRKIPAEALRIYIDSLRARNSRPAVRTNNVRRRRADGQQRPQEPER